MQVRVEGGTLAKRREKPPLFTVPRPAASSLRTAIPRREVQGVVTLAAGNAIPSAPAGRLETCKAGAMEREIRQMVYGT